MKLIDNIRKFYINNDKSIQKSDNLIICLGVYYALGLLSIIARTQLWPNNSYLKIVCDIVVTLIVFLIYKKCCRKQNKLEIWPKRNLSAKNFLYILSFLICMDLVSFAIMGIIYRIKGVDDVIIPGTVEYVGTDIDVIIRAVLLGPIIEELIFRGAGLSLFKKEDNKLEAILFTSIFFGLYHTNLAQAINSTIGGFIYGYVAIQYGLPYAILFHILNNGIVYIEYFLNIDEFMNFISIGILTFHVLNVRRIFKKLKINLKSQNSFSVKKVVQHFCDITIILYCSVYMYYIVKSII